MRKLLTLICIFILSLKLSASIALATSPQYVVMNFATINELDWAVPEDRWQQEIKPQIIDQLHQLEAALPRGTDSRKLAWSTLMEYMNFPLDTPSDHSPYIIKTKRILEIAQDEQLPIFIPLNGFQWWDELPELYNWWDSDGTHTDPAFFARQKRADFKARFIAGYNPDNKWNVEWQTPTTPMQLNYRNWGGGGFRLAPPPNLVDHDHATLTYHQVLTQRLRAIIQAIVDTRRAWAAQGKPDLLVGLSIGTEVSLNGSVTPADEFAPYGWRGIQDTICPTSSKLCLSDSPIPNNISNLRASIVNTYLTDLTRMVSKLGIEKDKLFTHTWGEITADNPKFTNYAAAAFTPYATAGLSFYGYATTPRSLPVWDQALQDHGNPAWGAVEYSAGTSEQSWKQGLANTFDIPHPASLMIIYNWTEQKHTGAIHSLRQFLTTTVPEHCELPNVTPVTEQFVVNPTTLQWNVLASNTPVTQTLHLVPGITVRDAAFTQNTNETIIPINTLATSLTLPTLKPGNYSWYIQTDGCDTQRVTTTPHVFTMTYTEKTSIPIWVQLILNVASRFSRK